MLTGFITRHFGFFRTPKQAKTHGFIQALMDAREELLFFAAMVLGAYAVHSLRRGGPGIADQRSAETAGTAGRGHAPPQSRSAGLTRATQRRQQQSGNYRREADRRVGEGMPAPRSATYAAIFHARRA